MAKNRLQLDWKLTSREDRNEYVRQYLDQISWTPTEAELDMMAKYILWGVNEEGLNGRQEGLDLPTRSHTWDQDTSEVESLDALLESPTFSENIIRKPDDPVFKTPKVQFSRTETRTSAPDHVISHFEDLWREIDELGNTF